jgi:Ca-activated chloride channel family protein
MTIRYHLPNGATSIATLLVLLSMPRALFALTMNDIGAGALLIEGDLPGHFNESSLLQTDVTMNVSGMLSRTTVSQRFHNDSDQWIEATYVFPLPDDASVDELEMIIGEQHIRGVIQTRQAARETFEQASREGRQTSLIEQQRANLYTTRVANVPPGEEVTISIAYQAPIAYRDGTFSLRFPMTMTPRYIPPPLLHAGDSNETLEYRQQASGWATPAEAIVDARAISPPFTATQNATPATIEINLDAGTAIADINSSSHKIISTQDGDRWHVALAHDRVPTDRDFTLSWQPPAGQEPVAALFRQDLAQSGTTEHAASDAGEVRSFASIMLIPPQDLLDQAMPAREVIFVIDTSGSMEGASINQARTALQLGVQRLQASDRFNIIEFNDQPRSLFRSAVEANGDNLRRANRWIQSLYAAGGTEIGAALEAALASDADAARVRQIVFITDGSVGNEAQIFARLPALLGNNRLFTVGIGSAPNTWFMRKAAELGRGTYTYIARQDEVGSRMLALFGKLERPALTNISLRWEGVDKPQIYPVTVPDLYVGEPVLADAMWEQKIDTGALVVSGYHNGREWTRKLDLGSTATSSGLGKRWAARAIEALDDSLLFGTSADKVETAITELALEFNLITRYTSLVAVAEAIARDPRTEPSQPVLVPAAMPAGNTMGFPQGALGLRGQLVLSAVLFSLSILLGLATLAQVRQR